MSEKKNYEVTIKDGILTLSINLNECEPQLTSTGRSATYATTGKYYIPVVDNNRVEYGISFSVFTKDRYIIEALKAGNSLVYPLPKTQVTPQQVTPQQVTPQQVTPQQVTPQQVTPQQVTPQVQAQAIDTNMLILQKIEALDNKVSNMQAEIDSLKTKKKKSKKTV